MEKEEKAIRIAIARTHPLHRVYEEVDEAGMGEPYIPRDAARNGVFREVIEWANAEYQLRQTGAYPNTYVEFRCCICERHVKGLRNCPAPYAIQKAGRRKYCCSYCHESVVTRYMMIRERCGDGIANMMKEEIRQESLRYRETMEKEAKD